MTPLLVENVSKLFKQGDREVRALDGVSLEVPTGRFFAVMGASGSGKSTLLHLMAGLTRPSSGRVVIGGTAIESLSDHALTLFRRRQIGLVFQSFNLIPTLTAEQNVALPLLLDGTPSADIRARSHELLARLGLGHRVDHRPDAMSGGEQQRVAICRALVTNPVILLADEPTGNLDSANSRTVCELLRDLARAGKTIVMVTHEPSVARYASDVAVLRDGRLVRQFEVDPEGTSGDVAAQYMESLQA